MTARPEFYAPDREVRRAWLRENHAAAREVWLVYYKKETGRPSIPYEDSVEEALCFGWIDSLIKKPDGERYASKFNPRTDTAKWSEPKRRGETSRYLRLPPGGSTSAGSPVPK